MEMGCFENSDPLVAVSCSLLQYWGMSYLSTGPLVLISGGSVKLTTADVSVTPSSPVSGSAIT